MAASIGRGRMLVTLEPALFSNDRGRGLGGGGEKMSREEKWGRGWNVGPQEDVRVQWHGLECAERPGLQLNSAPKRGQEGAGSQTLEAAALEGEGSTSL